MRSDDPRDPDNRDPSLFDDDEPRDDGYEAGRRERPQALFEDDADDEEERSAQELRYEGPITMDGHEDEYEDEGGGGGGRLLVTSAIVIGAVIVIVAVAMMMKTGGDASDEPHPEDRRAEVAALETTPDDVADDASTTAAGASIDYRAIPDAGPADAAPDAATDTAPPTRELASNEPEPVEKPRGAAGETAAETPRAPAYERPSPVPARQVEPAAGGESVGALARDGRVREAARLGRTQLAASGASHTLQVLYSCEPSNVQKAFRNVRDSDLTVVPAGDCYRVCFGTFASHAAATDAKRRVPSYFAGSGAFPKALDELALR